jgi:putative transposase
MKQKRFTDEQIIGILKEADTGVVVADLCRKHGMSSATFYAWKSKYGGLELSEARRLRGLEEENAKLKRLLAEAMLDNAGLKDLLGKNGDARCKARSGRTPPDEPWGERAAGVQHHRGGPEKRTVSAAARQRPWSARAVARVGPAASAFWIPAAAHLAAAGVRGDQPQEDAAALHRGRVDRTPTQVETPRSRRAGVLADDRAAERALVARLRA